jgi:uncharacterized protein (TIGR02246 family)
MTMKPAMRFMRIVGILTLTMGSAVSGSREARASESAIDSESVKLLSSAGPDILAANSGWLPALQRHDSVALAAPYSEDAVFVKSDGECIRGRSAIAAMYEARFAHQTAVLGGNVVQDQMVAVDGRIYEWGHAWLEMAGSVGNAPTKHGGPYFTVWKRGDDGHWRIIRNLAF